MYQKGLKVFRTLSALSHSAIIILFSFPMESNAEESIVYSADASDFVLLSDAVPDAILEIRYYSTYNFIGDRVEGCEDAGCLLEQSWK